MSLLTSHIERLLLHHDCVIVPGLGGFVAQECGARYVEEEDLLLPPYRAVTFNSRLDISDGLLASAVARSEGMPFENASAWIDKEVESIRKIIADRGSYLFPGVGLLEATRTSAYEFTPISCGITAPALYGLDSCYILSAEPSETVDNTAEMADNNREELTPAPFGIDNEEGSTSEYTRSHIYSFGTQILHYVAAAAIIAVCYIASVSLLPFSLTQGTHCEASMFQVITDLIADSKTNLQMPAPAAINSVSTSKSIADNHTFASIEERGVTEDTKGDKSSIIAHGNESKSADNKDNTATEIELVEVQKKLHPYTLVLASSLPKSSAEAFAAECRNAGIADVGVFVRGRMIRVICGSYETEDAARTALRAFTSAHPSLVDAWIYQIPE